MELEEREALYRRAFELWGEEGQVDMMIEECAELVVAISHWRRNRVSSVDVAEEVADVLIVCEQMRIIFSDVAPNVDSFVGVKLARLKTRIEKAESCGEG